LIKAPFPGSPPYAGRKLVVLMFVLDVHALALVILLWSGKQLDARRGPSPIEPTTVLLGLDLQSHDEQPPIDQRAKSRHPQGFKRAPANPVRTATPSAEGSRSDEVGGNAIINPEEPPRIDWQRESDAAVEAVTPNMIKEYTRLCAEADRPNTKHPAGCPRSFNEGYWRPSGNLLRDIRDPDRPRSSVPDLLPAFPKGPPSQVRIRPDP